MDQPHPVGQRWIDDRTCQGQQPQHPSQPPRSPSTPQPQQTSEPENPHLPQQLWQSPHWSLNGMGGSEDTTITRRESSYNGMRGIDEMDIVRRESRYGGMGGREDMDITRREPTYGGMDWVVPTEEVYSTSTMRDMSLVDEHDLVHMGMLDMTPQEASGQQAIFACCHCGEENKLVDERGGRCFICGHEMCFGCSAVVESFVARRWVVRLSDLERGAGLGVRRRLGGF